MTHKTNFSDSNSPPSVNSVALGGVSNYSDEAIKILIAGKIEILLKEIRDLHSLFGFKSYSLDDNIVLSALKCYKRSLEKRAKKKLQKQVPKDLVKIGMILKNKEKKKNG